MLSTYTIQDATPRLVSCTDAAGATQTEQGDLGALDTLAAALCLEKPVCEPAGMQGFCLPWRPRGRPTSGMSYMPEPYCTKKAPCKTGLPARQHRRSAHTTPGPGRCGRLPGAPRAQDRERREQPGAEGGQGRFGDRGGSPEGRAGPAGPQRAPCPRCAARTDSSRPRPGPALPAAAGRPRSTAPPSPGPTPPCPSTPPQSAAA